MNDPTLADALALHQSGRLAEAAEAYRRLLTRTPDDPNALHLLGVVELQSGSAAAAAELIERAIARQAGVGVFHLNHASALRTLGRIDDAIAEAEKAIALDAALAAQGYYIAGLAFADGGQPDDAVFCWRKSLESDSGHFDARVMLARSLRAAGDFPAAVAEAETLVQTRPGDAVARHELGCALRKIGAHREAITALDRALALDPKLTHALAEKAWTLGELNDIDAAVEAFEGVLARDGKDASSHLGAALAYAKRGELDRSIAHGRDAVRLDPHNAVHRSALLHSLHYVETDSQELFAEHLQWEQWHGAPLRSMIRPHDNDRDPDRPLRVGFVSADFCGHPVARFMQPVLAACDRKHFTFACYSATPKPDAATDRLIERAGEWHDVTRLDPAALADKIRVDRVDVLVDLAGHTARNRLLTFAQKPAPIQVTQFGYTDTTGLSAMDYRITDVLSDPPGTTERFHTEQLVRLADIAYCYEAPPDIPEVNPLRQGEGSIIFGSLNNNQKVTPRMTQAWQRLLDTVPGSRLLFLAASPAASTARTLARHGLDLSRVDIVPHASVADYFDLYNRIDVALDPFPFNGGVTTCDTLWMGVPLVTLAGDRYVARQGLSLLSHVGLSDIVATTTDDYIRIAAALANDPARRAHLRRTLRATTAASPVCDGAGYTRHLEAFFRDAWRRWCAAPRA